MLPLITGSYLRGTLDSFIPPTKATLRWWLNDGLPIPPTLSTFKLEAYFFIEIPGIIDTLTLRSIKGNFTASKGNFAPLSSWIDTGNVVRSFYTAPSISDSIEITAWIDADTFRSGKIAVKGSLSVKNVDVSSNVKIYPNPANENLYISHAQKGTQLILYSSEGRIVSQQTMNNEIEDINLSSLAKGLYILQLTDDKGNKIARQILKQ
ncbi:MAG: T9SS type A sorting domain-containing protein [Phycisphaerales bacterium]|nr:T9SS type A sorting domain-containing protein [Phycisphaerales bacterium]